MLLRTLDRAADSWVYPEHNRRAFDGDFRLRSLSHVESLIEESPAPIVLFKPICDSHRADIILDRFHSRGARALWIYRNYRDVTNSLVDKWGDHFITVIRSIASGDIQQVGWRGERLSEALAADVGRLAGNHPSKVDAAAIFWYLRNSFYFDLGLNEDPRVRLVSYDRLVAAPTEYLPAVFRFVRLHFDVSCARNIHRDSVNLRPAPPLSQAVESECEGLLARMDQDHP